MISCTMSEEYRGQSQILYHGNESATLLHPVVPSATQTGSIVQHSIREGFPLSAHHVSELIYSESGVIGVLVDVHTTCL